MAVNQASPIKPAFEIKGGNFTALVMHLASPHPESIQALIQSQLGLRPVEVRRSTELCADLSLPADHTGTFGVVVSTRAAARADRGTWMREGPGAGGAPVP